MSLAQLLRRQEKWAKRYALNLLGPDMARDLVLLEALGLLGHPGIELSLRVQEQIGLAIGILLLEPEDQVAVRVKVPRRRSFEEAMGYEEVEKTRRNRFLLGPRGTEADT